MADFSIYRLIFFCILIMVAFTISCSHPSIATDKGSESDFVKQVVTRLKPLQRNGWLEWTPGTVLVTTFLLSDPKKFASHVPADLTYTIGEKNTLTRTQLFRGISEDEEVFPGRSQDGPIPVARFYKPNSGVATQLSLDGNEIKCRQFRETIPVPLGAGPLVEPFLKEWIIPSHPTICLRWESGKNYGVIKSIRATRTVGGKKYSCVVLEKRMALDNDGFSLETAYLSPEVPGFVVERTQDIYKSTEDRKPLRIHERVKSVTVPK
jgi:hypothetical protein